MSSNPHSRRALLSLAASSLILAGCATRPNSSLMVGSLDVGRNAQGDPCRANRTYDDATLKGEFDAGFVMTCRSVTASRSVGAQTSTGTRERRSIDCAREARREVPPVM